METPGATLVRLRAEIALEQFEIPDSSPRVQITQLQRDHRGSILLVRFPAGWSRPASGSYECTEEFVVLEGRLDMNGVHYGVGDWVVVPPGVQRADSTSADGCLALARWDGKAKWTRGSGVSAQLRPVSLAGIADFPDVSPFGPAVMLNDAGAVHSWMLQQPPATDPIALDTELLDVHAKTWAWIPAGAPFPAFEGPVFCRTYIPSPEERA